MKNNILDYEQINENLSEIIKNGVIKEAQHLAITEGGLPIRHFIVGNGNEDIVITGATHGSEIITSDFVVKLMQNIDKNSFEWKNILKNFTLHFVPVLNPEGYLISTSAIRKLIPREMSIQEAQNLCYRYYSLYKLDDTKSNNNVKLHLKMFDGIDYTCIPQKYSKIRENVKNILDKNPDLPKNCMHIWSANSNGIDIQANSNINPCINKIMNNEKLYMKSQRHNNIDYSHPGPINCPFDKDKGFKFERETKAISDLLESLNKEGKLFAYLNYHSTGGMIFQRPAYVPEEMNISKEEIEKKEIVNFLFARLYSDNTYKSKEQQANNNYLINLKNSKATSTNDIFRLLYPVDLLIELSPMGGNPIGPYGDIKGNYKNVMKSNFNAFKTTLELASLTKDIANASYKFYSKFEENKEYNKIIQMEDLIYKEFMDKVNNFKVKKEKDEYER